MTSRSPDQVHDVEIAVVVPVYADVAVTRTCLESAMPAITGRPRTRLIVVDDASPDPEMAPMLRAFRDQRAPWVTLIENPQNLGFVGSVNRGMHEAGKADVILLNSDVIAVPNWVERLAEDAYRVEMACTVTPLCNNTTIATFPEFLQDNAPPFGLDCVAVDAAFRNPRLSCVEAPTGVGFCMYIRRQCLDQVGYFDEERFGRGYGEENDFCQRAMEQGWKNLLSPNLYVWHLGGVSFGAEKAQRLQTAQQVLDSRHPTYQQQIMGFICSDPLRPARIFRLLSLAARTPQPKILHVTHALDGGVRQHVEELGAALVGRAISLVLSPLGPSFVNLAVGVSPTADSLVVDVRTQLPLLLRLLVQVGVSAVHYHHTMRLPPAVIELPRRLGARTVLTVHDFYLMNGNPTLTDQRGVFPGHYDERLENPDFPLPPDSSLESWTRRQTEFLACTNLTIFPSQAAQALFQEKYLPADWAVAYHPEPNRPEKRSVAGIAPSQSGKYRVAILGALGVEKGADLLEAVALERLSADFDLEFILIGYAYRRLAGVIATGPYQRERLVDSLRERQCDLILFTARCPETYSYTLSYALASGLPIVAPRLGAFPERLRGRPHTLLFDHLSSPQTIKRQLVEYVASLIGRPPADWQEADVGWRGDFYPDGYLRAIRAPTIVFAPGAALRNLVLVLAATKPREPQTPRSRLLSLLLCFYARPELARVIGRLPYSFKRAVKRVLGRGARTSPVRR